MKASFMTDLPPPRHRSHWPWSLSPKLGILCLCGVTLIFSASWLLLQSPLFGHSRSAPSPSPPPTPPFASSDQAIAAIGRVEPEGEIIAVSAPALVEGAKVDRLLVKLGDRVRRGQVIAILDNYERLSRELELSRQQLHVANMRLVQVRSGAKTADILAQASRVEELRRELEGQMASQSLSIRRLNYELRNAKIECSRYDQLFQAGAVSASQRDQICLLADTSQQEKLEAQAQLQRTQKTLAQKINEAQANQVAIAEVRPTDVSVAAAQVQEAWASVKHAEANLALSLVRSPRDGQILKVIAHEGEKIGNDGVVKLGNTDKMTVVAEVYETDVSRVKIGQKAIVNSQGLTQGLEGVVSEIGLTIGKQDVLGTDPAAASDARVLEVRISLSPESSRLARGLSNLQVDVVIHAGPSHGVRFSSKASQ